MTSYRVLSLAGEQTCYSEEPGALTEELDAL